jgi:RNA polymerase sigma factor (TIGR02999 family)
MHMDSEVGSGRVTPLLRQWRSGDESLLEELTPLIYLELRVLARAGNTPPELVHEAFLRLVRQERPDWANRAHFYCFSARLMRQTQAQKRGGEQAAVPLEDALHVTTASAPSVIRIHDVLNARVSEMRYFGGLTAEEIAQAENLSSVTVTHDVRAATAWLSNSERL